MSNNVTHIRQTDRILAYMRLYGSITQLEALQECGVMRLASRINDLKRDGYKIKTATKRVQGRYGSCTIAEYSLDK